MAYRLSIADELPATLRACAREQLEGAIAQLDGGGASGRGALAGEPATAIHEARKHLKKTRALLRLARPALGSTAYRRENAALREAARSLSDVRDADVLIATVDALATEASGRLPASDFAAVRAALALEAAARRAAPETVAGVEADAPASTAPGDATGAPPGPPARVAAEVADMLRAALARVERWPLDGADWDGVVEAAARAYARGRDAYDVARSERAVDALHAWRKRVKDLWYHHRLLQRVWPPVMDALGGQADELSELLGDDHDLAVLHGRLATGAPLPPGAAADLGELLALVDERRAALQERAWRLGGRLYAERPRAFERRLRIWVRAAVAETSARR